MAPESFRIWVTSQSLSYLFCPGVFCGVIIAMNIFDLALGGDIVLSFLHVCSWNLQATSKISFVPKDWKMKRPCQVKWVGTGILRIASSSKECLERVNGTRREKTGDLPWNCDYLSCYKIKIKKKEEKIHNKDQRSGGCCW